MIDVGLLELDELYRVTYEHQGDHDPNQTTCKAIMRWDAGMQEFIGVDEVPISRVLRVIRPAGFEDVKVLDMCR